MTAATLASNFRPRSYISVIFVGVACGIIGCQESGKLATEVRDLEMQVARAGSELSAQKEALWSAEARADVLARETFSSEVGSPVVSTDIDRQNLVARELANAWNKRKESLELVASQGSVSEVQRDATSVPEQTRHFVDGGEGGVGSRIPGTATRIHEAEMRQGARLADDQTIEEQSLTSAVFSREFLLVWLVCLCTLLIVWAIVRQDLRHRIRAYRRTVINEIWLGVTSYAKSMPRLVWVSSWFCVAVLSLIVGLVSLRPHRPSGSELLEAHKQRLEKRLAEIRTETEAVAQRTRELEADAARSEQANNQKFVSYVQGLTTELVGPQSGTSTVIVDNALAQMRGTSKSDGTRSLGTAEVALSRLRDFGESVGVAKSAKPEFDQVIVEVDRNDKTLADFEAAARSHTRQVVIGETIAVGLFFLANVGLVLSWRNRRKKLNRAISEVCPRCLSEKTLKVVPAAQGGSIVECQNDTCKYRMELGSRTTNRLRLPLVGLTEAGKTVWLTMFHRSVEQGRADTKLAKFDRATSPVSEDVVYDKVLERLVEREETRRTPYEATRLREPLLFHFSDGDTYFAPSNGVLNVFDLAGAISSPHLRGSEAQDRAYRATDGFFYFVDPTRVDEKYLNMQREQLLTFCEELRRKRNVPYGTPLHVPIAICISKLDMLAKPGEAGAGVYQEFIDKLNPATRDLQPNLKELRRRHTVFASYRDQLFPGWDIEEQFQKLVGGRYMFFPMSAAGFTGVTGHDPKDWNFKPFGVVEPLVWLLHMNGYKTI